jgi:hypothetical protein
MTLIRDPVVVLDHLIFPGKDPTHVSESQSGSQEDEE